ncbi:MAG: hypothetical protein PHG54_12485 [Smithellaceae bacterium]|nr:hypothetical protein [Syntrophaceae bacterium]MDD4242237.1 hypothetical protein [Smithellaceae bacterium]NLX52999.1 hypothetical protein [Deltaproteobacteria bacterium]
MTDILDYISTWSALKWVALVLIAGFIGQFGRMMAEAIIVRARLKRAGKKRQGEAAALPDSAPRAAEEMDPVESLPAGPSSSGTVLPAAAASAFPDKKALKALAKARKKEAKKEAKQNSS